MKEKVSATVAKKTKHPAQIIHRNYLYNQATHPIQHTLDFLLNLPSVPLKSAARGRGGWVGGVRLIDGFELLVDYIESIFFLLHAGQA